MNIKKVMMMAGLLTAGMLTAVASDVKRETYVYAVKDGDSLRLDTYMKVADCKSATTEEPRAVMIYVHGGGFSAGSRKNAGQEVFVRHLAEQGMVAVQIDYRLGAAPQNKWGITNMKEAIRLSTEDLVSATCFVLDHQKEWNIDPSKIVISGGSAGAICCLTTEYDLCNGEAYTRVLPEGFNYAGLISHAGAVPTADTLTWKRQPCPMMLMHGTNDQLVPLEKNFIDGNNYCGSIYISRQLEAMQVAHWLYLVKGADHVVAMKPLIDNHEEQDLFIRKYVNQQHKAVTHTEWADEVPDNMSSVDEMVKAVPLYIIGFGKYLEELNFEDVNKPTEIVY